MKNFAKRGNFFFGEHITLHSLYGLSYAINMYDGTVLLSRYLHVPNTICLFFKVDFTTGHLTGYL